MNIPVEMVDYILQKTGDIELLINLNKNLLARNVYDKDIHEPSWIFSKSISICLWFYKNKCDLKYDLDFNDHACEACDYKISFLSLASWHGRFDVVRYMIEELGIKDCLECSFNMACYGGHLDIVEYLKPICDPNVTDVSYSVIRSESVDMLKLIEKFDLFEFCSEICGICRPIEILKYLSKNHEYQKGIIEGLMNNTEDEFEELKETLDSLDIYFGFRDIVESIDVMSDEGAAMYLLGKYGLLDICDLHTDPGNSICCIDRQDLEGVPIHFLDPIFCVLVRDIEEITRTINIADITEDDKKRIQSIKKFWEDITDHSFLPEGQRKEIFKEFSGVYFEGYEDETYLDLKEVQS